MNKAAVFDQHAREYDQWYDQHANLYQSELRALEQAVPSKGTGIEIGVGTGRFAQPLGIQYGLEPAENMAQIAETRGITVYRGYAENLPLDASTFDHALMVTTVCFLSDLPKAFAEVHRILKPGGVFVIGLIDKNSPLGQRYESKKANDKFYQNARLHSVADVTAAMECVGFQNFDYWQTLMDLDSNQEEKPEKGYGSGGFVVVRGRSED